MPVNILVMAWVTLKRIGFYNVFYVLYMYSLEIFTNE
jgi:hypothetical protein